VTTVVLVALALVAATVTVHAVGLSALLKYYLPELSRPPMRVASVAWLLIGLTWALCAIHGIEIMLWAVFYGWAGCLPDFESSLYFSGVTYATVGYGDLVLPARWRMLGPVEGMTGGLMSGLSTAVFFAFVSRVHLARHRGEPHLTRE
jgi:hypothetical protein